MPHSFAIEIECVQCNFKITIKQHTHHKALNTYIKITGYYQLCNKELCQMCHINRMFQHQKQLSDFNSQVRLEFPRWIQVFELPCSNYLLFFFCTSHTKENNIKCKNIYQEKKKKKNKKRAND